jgi:predicted RNA-binding protein with PUA-like domain
MAKKVAKQVVRTGGSGEKGAAGPRRYWLLKSEPNCYSIDDFARDKVTFWDGVRNYQARNMLRDEMRVGDGALFYHSSTDPLAIVGLAEIVRAGYPDHTQFDPSADHYDADSPVDDPRWFMVDVKLTRRLPRPVTRAELQEDKRLAGMVLLQRGSRLSVQPVTEAEWNVVMELAGRGA